MEAGKFIAGQEVAPDDLLVAGIRLSGTMAVALIEMYLVICGGAILVGFGGFEYTRDIALSYLLYSVYGSIRCQLGGSVLR